MGPIQGAAILTVLAAFASMAAVCSAARSNGDPLQEGEIVQVLFNVPSQSSALISFMMCGMRYCNEVYLYGLDGQRLHWNKKTNTNEENRNGQVGTFPHTLVVSLTRCSGFLHVNFHDFPNLEEPWVELKPDQNRLIIKAKALKTSHPYNSYDGFFSFIDHSTWLKCENGGQLHWSSNTCTCPPGFHGPLCENACSPNYHGKLCEKHCESPRGCRGARFGWEVGGQNKTICAAGFQGLLCDQVCRPGQYGASCLLTCGQCESGRHCDPYTGECPEGCEPGYRGDNCKQALTYLMAAPRITDVTNTSFSGSFMTSDENVAGSGTVTYFDVQYKVISSLELLQGVSKDWISGAVGKLSGLENRHNFTVEHLKPGSHLYVRIILTDDQLQGYPAVPYTEVFTLKLTVISNIRSTVMASEAIVSWTSSGDRPLILRYECVKLLACPSESCSSQAELVSVGHETNANLSGLFPGAVYRVSIGPEDDETLWESVKVVTKFTVPEVAPEAVLLDADASDKTATELRKSPGVISVDNTTVVVHWRQPGSCAALNGVLVGYRWQLFVRSRSCPDGCLLSGPDVHGTTSGTSVQLKHLHPDTEYEARVNVVNTEGYNPDLFASFRFST